MDEEREVLRRLHAEGKRAAVATVVHVAGSAYRHEGARMVVDETGATYGTISGGCLEGEVRELALRVLRTGRPELARFDLTADDDVVWGLGLGCNGVVDVYVEPAAQAAAEPAGEARAESPGEPAERGAGSGEETAPAVLATVIAGPEPGPAPPGSRLLVRGGRIEGSLGHPALDGAVLDDARRLLALGVSRTYGYRLMPGGGVEAVRDRRALLEAGGDVIRVFLDVSAPPPLLLVFGAGHDAVPVVRFARAVGFRVVVVDPRDAYLTRERFPEADALIRAHPEDVPERVPLPEGAFAVIMTHNFNHDRELLRVLLDRPLAYLGLLGPAERADRLFAELAREGVPVSEARRRAVHSPIGLDIGAEGPEQIALAIVAEILAVRRGRAGGFLRHREGPLHPEWRTA